MKSIYTGGLGFRFSRENLEQSSVLELCAWAFTADRKKVTAFTCAFVYYFFKIEWFKLFLESVKNIRLFLNSDFIRIFISKMLSLLWHKVCAKISEWRRNSTVCKSELASDPENPKKKSKSRSAREIQSYGIAFLLFYWLIGAISCGHNLYLYLCIE